MPKKNDVEEVRPRTPDTHVTFESSNYTENDEFQGDFQHAIQSAIGMAKRNSGVVEFFVYLIFLGLFTLVALLAHPGEDLIQHNKALRNAVSDQEIFFEKSQVKKVYQDIDSVDEYWDWLMGPFIHTLLSTDFPNQPGFFYPYFRILGLMRIRQVRVQRNSCEIPKELSTQVVSCLAEYSAAAEESSSYGPIDSATGSPMWTWRSAEELGEGSYTGRSGIRFAGSGYNQAIEVDLARAKDQLEFLRANRWIDVQTRAVFVDFLAYNANLNFLSLVKVATEFPASSGVKPYVLVRTAPISFILPSEGGSTSFVAECLILVLVVLYLGVEVLRIRAQGWLYLADPWHYLDWLNYIAFIAAFSLRLLPLQLVAASGFPPAPAEFVNYERPMWAIVQWHNVVALNAVLTWLRLFKYAKNVPFMALLVRTLSKAAGQTLAFCSMLFVVYFGFSLAHHVAFGADLHAFRTLLNTMFALYRVLLTADYFDEMYDSNRLLGPLFFFAWTLIGFFVLLHMFIAILNEAIVFAQLDLPKASVSDTVAGAIEQSKSAVSTVLHHRHATLALHKLNFRIHELPADLARSPAQHLLAEALDLERVRLEAEAEARPSEEEGAIGGAQHATKAAATSNNGEVAQRLEAMEIHLFRAHQALKLINSGDQGEEAGRGDTAAGGRPARVKTAKSGGSWEGSEAGKGSRTGTARTGTARSGGSLHPNPRSSLHAHHPLPAGTPRAMATSPSGALIIGAGLQLGAPR